MTAATVAVDLSDTAAKVARASAISYGEALDALMRVAGYVPATETAYRSRHDGGPDYRGNTRDRRRRREWLVNEFRANADVIVGASWVDGEPMPVPVQIGVGAPACRCYRCGELLTAATVTADRWPVPGCQGGRYTRNNIRPACATCNSTAGATLRSDQHDDGRPW